jgi:hypothetical protein
MKTLIIIEVEHRKPLPFLANMIAGRAYTIDGVTNASPFRSPGAGQEMSEQAGFTLDELRLGASEVVRT